MTITFLSSIEFLKTITWEIIHYNNASHFVKQVLPAERFGSDLSLVTTGTTSHSMTRPVIVRASPEIGVANTSMRRVSIELDPSPHDSPDIFSGAIGAGEIDSNPKSRRRGVLADVSRPQAAPSVAGLVV